METEQDNSKSSPEQLNPIYDAVIVLGKNIGGGWGKKQIEKQKYHLSDPSRINMHVAGILYTRGLTRKIIIAGGKVAGDSIPSEAEAYKKRLQQIWPSIPDEDIILEDASKVTTDNATNIKRVLGLHPDLQNLALVTIGPHMDRARGIFEDEGINISHSIISEDFLSKRFPKMAKKYKHESRWERLGEAAVTPVLKNKRIREITDNRARKKRS